MQEKIDSPPPPDDWEEWDGSSPFWVHCLAGSIAGCIEHLALYPLDTVRTHIQVCAACIHANNASTTANSTPKRNTPTMPSSSWIKGTHHLQKQPQPPMIRSALPLGMWGTIRYLMNEPVAAAASNKQPPQLAGIARLFRGISTVWMGCIPAHALYFSSYEGVKAYCSDSMPPLAVSALAGAAAVTGHDVIMTPLDTLKQRFQIGHFTPHTSVRSAFTQVLRTEGRQGLYASVGVTLATNIPYGMIMVATQDAVRGVLEEEEDSSQQYSTSTVLLASSCGGCLAAALTTPLDRIKTALQTQALAPTCLRKKQMQQPCPLVVVHDTWQKALQHIYTTEGWRGLWRGWVPRVLAHTPAVAISWTTYESVKQWLL